MRTGFSLIELLLVLALLVVGAAIASAGLFAGNERAALRRAGAQLEQAWSEGRLRAIESGTPMVFRCRLGESWGYVGDRDTPDVEALEAETLNAIEQASSHSELQIGESESTNAVVFQQLLVAPRPGEPALGGAVPEGELSAMIVFYPDGSTSDAEATLAIDSGRTLLVTLRGLTGSVRITDPLDDSATGGTPSGSGQR